MLIDLPTFFRDTVNSAGRGLNLQFSVSFKAFGLLILEMRQCKPLRQVHSLKQFHYWVIYYMIPGLNPVPLVFSVTAVVSSIV